jgi:N-glycosylase/DNA lyase
MTFREIPLSLSQLSLAAVLQCGQSFRWSIFPLAVSAGQGETAPPGQPSHEYRLCLRDRVICLRQSQEALLWNAVFPSVLAPEESVKRDGETLEWINDYFQLDVDLKELYRTWSERDPIFHGLQERFSGIRILRQDPWENLISCVAFVSHLSSCDDDRLFLRFICSSNNNISRISKMVKSLCTNYSPPLLSFVPPSGSEEPEPYHPFPPPSALAAPEVAAKLRALGFGYRADFIQKTAKMLVERDVGPSPSKSPSTFYAGQEPAEVWLTSLREEPTATAREELIKLMGVGRKVADCVLLMSLNKVRSVFTAPAPQATVRVDRFKFSEGSRSCRHPRPPNRPQALRGQDALCERRQSTHDSKVVRRGRYEVSRCVGGLRWVGTVGRQWVQRC